MISQFIYRRLVHSHKLEAKFWHIARQALLKIYDPSCTMVVHGRSLRMPFSHQLPAILKNHPYYDSLPARLSAFIRGKYGYVKVADVGANIGDSVTAFRGCNDDRFLAVEANPRFIEYLNHNIGGVIGVTIVEAFCADSEDNNKMFSVREQGGTAEIIPGQGIRMRTVTLDSLIKEKGFSDLNIIKVDTDGHDLKVLKGASRILECQPAVLFEFYAWGEDCIDGWRSFLQSLRGYKDLILYDQTGLLMGRYPIHDFSSIADLLYYQAIEGFISFDALLMKPEYSQEFFQRERAFFAQCTRPSPTAL